MVNVSKKKLDPVVEKRLNRDFGALLGYPKTASARTKLIEQFFTPSERMLFAKRIAVILMLENKISFNTIEEEMGVSPSTVNVYYRKVIRGQCKSVTAALAHLYSKKRGVDILTVLFNTPRARKQMKKEMHDLAKSVGAQLGTR
jgi:uncharacterized protein YerC